MCEVTGSNSCDEMYRNSSYTDDGRERNAIRGVYRLSVHNSHAIVGIPLFTIVMEVSRSATCLQRTAYSIYVRGRDNF